MDYIVVMRNGEVGEEGTYEELQNGNGAFAEFLKTYSNDTFDSDNESGLHMMHSLRFYLNFFL
jgi:hypothetical protein